MSGSKSKQKGNRGELLGKKILEGYGVKVIRGKQKDEQDLVVDGFGEVEIKYGKHVPKKIYSFFKKETTLAVMCKRCGKDEHKKWLLIVPIDIGINLLK